MTNSTNLIIGGTGKTGRRITTRLQARDLPVRVASRSSHHRFDWYDDSTWDAALAGAAAAYLVPPLDPLPKTRVAAFAERTVAHGVGRLVLLSGRGVGTHGRGVPTYEASLAIEEALRASEAAWTILRPSWFMQNFNEDFLLDGVLAGEVRVPTGDGREPFIDADDIADVAVAALTEDGHAGQAYELSGPRTLSMADAVQEIAAASGRDIRFVAVTAEEYAAELFEYGVPAGDAEAFGHLFSVIRRGVSDHVSDGVQRVLGREPRDFADWAADTAATSAWNHAAAS